jgi:hypothetical protein
VGLFWLLFHWRTRDGGVSPNGTARVFVKDFCTFPDCLVSIEVSKGWGTTEIANGNDCYIAFAHVTWVGPVVVALVDGTFCGFIQVAYDTEKSRPVDFAAYEGTLKEDVVRKYSVTPAELHACKDDIREWASYSGSCRSYRATNEWRRSHPTPLF